MDRASQIWSMQERTRAVASLVRQLWRGLYRVGWGFAAMTVLLFFTGGLASALSASAGICEIVAAAFAGVAIGLIASMIVAGAFVAFGSSLVGPISLTYQRAQRAQLRKQLRGLSPREREAVLVPLLREGDLTARIVEPLVRELSLHTELAPAAVFEGRGDELASS